MTHELEIGKRDDELTATVALMRARVVPDHRLALYIDHVGSAVRLAQLSEADRLRSIGDPIHEVIGAVTPAGLDMAAREIDQWRSRGLQFYWALDDGYPTHLTGIFNRPPILFVEGEWIDRVDRNSIAIVGTRGATEMGLRRARKLAADLAGEGLTIVSGMARGIDTVAHETALDVGARTVAVMGTSIDARYPAENRGLADRIVESGGALVSQFLPTQGPRPWTFPQRNVTMSGLTLGTVVVEASETSGAKMQARVALQHGRTVFLLESLVASHAWAEKYVSEGVYDVRAIEISSTEDIVDRLRGRRQPEPLAV